MAAAGTAALTWWLLFGDNVSERLLAMFACKVSKRPLFRKAVSSSKLEHFGDTE